MRKSPLKNDITPLLMSPIGLAKLDNPRYLIAKHLLLIDEKLRDMLCADSPKHLMVLMPPRHGKSELCSHYFPAWDLMMNPYHRIILTSYAAEFAAHWGRKVRNTLETFGKYYNVDIDPRSSAADRLDLLGTGGGFVTAGVGGQITGRGADVLIIDDPVKNAQDAMSKTLRDQTWDWFRSVAYTRLEPNGIIVLVATRWHDDDLAGRLLKTSPQDWELLRLPAIAEQDDVLGRSVGEALWPQRYSAERLEQIRESIGEYYWNALYQQTPVDVEGALFKQSWMDNKTVQTVPPREAIYRAAYCDLAASESATSDYTAIAIMSRDDNGLLYVESVKRIRASWGVTRQTIINELLRFNPDIVGIEAAGVQRALADDLLREPALSRLRIKADVPIGDKVSRAMPLAARIQAGVVYFVEGDYITDLIAEMLMFPRGQHDDQVDALAGAYKMLSETAAVDIW